MKMFLYLLVCYNYDIAAIYEYFKIKKIGIVHYEFTILNIILS